MLLLFGYLSGGFSIIAYLPYLRDIFKLKTKPERASWFIWSVLGSIAFFSQLAKGASNSLWLTGVQTFGVAFIFLISIKYGVGGFMRRDIIALICAGVGLVLWNITKNSATALYVVILIDAAGAILTVMKSYEDPASETMITWILSGTAGIWAAFAVGSFNIVLLSYPTYIAMANFAVAIAIVVGFQKKRLVV